MTNKQAKRKVLAHWRRMLKLSVEDIKAGKEMPVGENCAFCQMYAIPFKFCSDCPVAEKSGRANCHGTPYYDAHRLYYEIYFGSHKRPSEFRQAVQREIKFLESLEV